RIHFDLTRNIAGGHRPPLEFNTPSLSLPRDTHLYKIRITFTGEIRIRSRIRHVSVDSPDNAGADCPIVHAPATLWCELGGKTMSLRNVFSIAVAGLVLIISIPIESSAQVSASIGGSVSDPTGALIPGVEVTATNVNTGISTTQLTNEAGAYQMPSLQPGTYRLRALLAGFQTATRENIQLSQGQQVRFNFTLLVGTVATAVEVLADSATAL